jgi:hypothetical protein
VALVGAEDLGEAAGDGGFLGDDDAHGGRGGGR